MWIGARNTKWQKLVLQFDPLCTAIRSFFRQKREKLFLNQKVPVRPLGELWSLFHCAGKSRATQHIVFGYSYLFSWLGEVRWWLWWLLSAARTIRSLRVVWWLHWSRALITITIFTVCIKQNTFTVLFVRIEIGKCSFGSKKFPNW